ncbi:MAG: hypothetical protein JRH20_27515 [Deltaproteobacteria bacterium]|nr:hypothetical protein [Deltaproteobacteria bacterium]
MRLVLTAVMLLFIGCHRLAPYPGAEAQSDAAMVEDGGPVRELALVADAADAGDGPTRDVASDTAFGDAAFGDAMGDRTQVPSGWAWSTGVSDTHIKSVVVHVDGSITAVGWSGLASQTLCNGTLTTPARAPIGLVFRLDPQGQCQWVKVLESTEESRALAVSLYAGVIYVTGSFLGTMTLESAGGGSVSSTASAFSGSLFVAALQEDGKALWLQSRGPSFNAGPRNVGQAIVATASGVYVTGTVNNMKMSSVCNFTECMFSLYVESMSKADGGTNWSQTYGAGGLYAAVVSGLAVDSAGGVFFGGTFSFAVTIGTDSLATGTKTGRAGFIAKLGAGGDALWANQYGRGRWGNEAAQIHDIALAPGSGAYAVGEFGQTLAFPKGATDAVHILTASAAESYFDGFFLQVRSDGSTEFVDHLGAPQSDHALKSIAFSDGIIYLAGDVTGPYALDRARSGSKSAFVATHLAKSFQDRVLFTASPSSITDLEPLGAGVILSGSVSADNVEPALTPVGELEGFVALRRNL